MAELNKEDILKLAQLSRLKLGDAEIKEFQAEINEILEYVRMLDGVDTKGLKPTYQVTGLKNATRADVVVRYGMTQDDLLKNLPSREKSYIKTKRIL
jgi:aspartyl-tRNA(Asn)/glutamyl-tRNA(Gln) amidotransferase subunit C